MEKDPHRMNDYSLNRMTGLLHYVLIHIKSNQKQGMDLSFDDTSFDDLYHAVCAISKRKLTNELKMLTHQYVEFYFNREGSINYISDMERFIENIKINDGKLYCYPVGIKNGLSGVMWNRLNLSI